MNSYLFVIRAYNDVDHFTPLLDYLCRTGRAKVYLFSAVHPDEFQRNEAIAYLEREHGLRVRYLMEAVSTGFARRLDGWLRRLLRFVRGLVLPQRIRNVVGDVLTVGFKRIAKGYENIGADWAVAVLDECRPDLLIYDWADPAKFPWGPLTRLGRERGIPVVSLPHGINSYLDDAPAGGKDKVYAWNKKLEDEGMAFDLHVTQGELGVMHLSAQGVPAGKIHALGSLRYERDWLDRYPELNRDPKHRPGRDQNGKLKVVVFASKLHFKAFPDQVKALIKATVGPGRTVVVKPHTRGMVLDFLRGALSSGDIVVETNASSYALIQWCDVAIVWGSSIGLQVLGDGKPLIYPQFVHEPETIYGKYLPDCQVNSVEELVAALDRMEMDCAPCYSQAQVDALFRDVVYAGRPEHSVAERYATFLEDAVRARQA